MTFSSMEDGASAVFLNFLVDRKPMSEFGAKTTSFLKQQRDESNCAVFASSVVFIARKFFVRVSSS